ncbi:hypothetical protein PR048_031780 [Dryococelus australis]|uniref:Uncharacterized protein n=1 Tax=Dryococelus australis TaxID=614101 RepID=A0ABQ9G8W0_9NEOP|nr:hypothetical protein PR048_031780 [Dryococelus australis]
MAKSKVEMISGEIVFEGFVSEETGITCVERAEDRSWAQCWHTAVAWQADWPGRSPDLSPRDSFLWRLRLKTPVYQLGSPPPSPEDIIERLRAAAAMFGIPTLDRVQDACITRAEKCIPTCGDNFEYIL